MYYSKRSSKKAETPRVMDHGKRNKASSIAAIIRPTAAPTVPPLLPIASRSSDATATGATAAKQPSNSRSNSRPGMGCIDQGWGASRTPACMSRTTKHDYHPSPHTRPLPSTSRFLLKNATSRGAGTHTHRPLVSQSNLRHPQCALHLT